MTKRKKIFLFIIFFSITSISFAQSFNIETTIGIQGGKIKFLPYNYFNLPLGWGDKKSETNIAYDIAGKYYIHKYIYIGLNINYHKIKTTGLSELSYDEYDFENNIEGHSTIGSWDFERNQISNSISIGYHLFRTGIFVELGGTYFYNTGHFLKGKRIFYKDYITSSEQDLENLDYGTSSSFGYNAGFGLRFKNKGIYFLLKFNFLLENPSNTGSNTSLEIAHNQQQLLFGIGYPISTMNKESD